MVLFKLAAGQTISEAEYFFDTDPGPGNGIPISIVAGDPVTFTETINTSGLSPGLHYLFVRTRTSTGHWSLYEPQEFIIDGGIIAAEYFFDVDPGIGNGTPLTISTNTGTVTESISTSALDDGEHFLFVRTRHDNNTWSLSEPQVFYIQTRIVEAEYFIDTDPGFGNGTPLTIGSPSDLITITPTITIPVLSDGPHYLFIRTKDILGNWSFYEPQEFTVDSALPIELLEFKATPLEGQVLLNWATASEINNDYFTVEHAYPGKDFYEIFRIPGAGTRLELTRYQHYHTKPVTGINYYRLKQTDFDKRFTYSQVVSATVTNSLSMAVYPNPIQDKWFVEFYRDANLPRLLEVYDLMGKRLFIHTSQGERILEFMRGDFSSGTYLLRVTEKGGAQEIYKLIFK